MKSFLDRFRRKSSDEDEADRKTESARDLADLALQKRAAAAAAAAAAKAGGKDAPAEDEPGAAGTPAVPALAEATPNPRKDEIITFTLGDFLSRVPSQLLIAGDHDTTVPLTFEVVELSARIAKGQTTIPLAEIYKRVPKIFRGEIRESDNIEIRFPWQKLLELVKAANSPNPQPGLTEAAAEALAQKLRGRKKNVVPSAAVAAAGSTPLDRAGGKFPGNPRQPSWFSRPTVGGSPAQETGMLPLETAPAPAPAPAVPAMPSSIPAPAPLTDLISARTLPADGSDEDNEPETPMLTMAPLPPHASAAPLTPVPPSPTLAPPSSGAASARMTAEEILKRELGTTSKATDDRLATMKAEHDAAIRALKEELDDLYAERDRALADLAEAQKSMAGNALAASGPAPGEVDELKREIESLKVGLEAKSQEIRSLQSSQDEHHLMTGAEFAALSQERDHHRSATETRMAEVESLRREAEAQKTELNGLRERLSEFEKAAREAAAEREADRAELEKRTAELDALRAEAKSQGKQLDREQGYFQQLQQTAEAGLAAVTADRDRFHAELEAQKAELQAAQKRIEQLSHAAKAELAEADAERERLRQETVTLSQSLAAAQSELDAIRAKATTQHEELTQQHAQLSEQLATLQKAENARVEGDRSVHRDSQRQVEELQRRIMGLETTQKEVAQELSRERELRIKAERTAAAADRARGEASALVESLRNDARRDAETTARKRDAEFARSQKELQDRIDELAESASKLKSERDGLNAEVGRLREAAVVANAAPADWENRAISSLEADIENYRSRIKSLLKERDALTKDRDQLTSTHAASLAEFEALKTTSSETSAQIAALQQERDALAAQIAGVESRLTEAEAAAAKAEAEHLSRHEQLVQANALQAQEAEKVAATLRSLGEERTALENQLAEVTALKAQALENCDKLTAEVAALNARPAVDPKVAEELQAAQTALALAQESLAARGTELDQIRAEIEKVRAAAASQEAVIKELTSQRDAARKRVEKQLTRLQELEARPVTDPAIEAELATVRAALVSAEQARDAATAEVSRLTEAHASAIQTTSSEREAQAASLKNEVALATEARAKAEEEIAALTKQRDAARKRVEKLQAEVEELIARPVGDPNMEAELAAVKSALAAAEQARESVVAELEKAREAALAELSGVKEAHAVALQKTVGEFEAQIASLKSEVAAVSEERTKADAEVAVLAEQRDAARKRVEKLQAEVEELVARPVGDPNLESEVATLKSALAAAEQAREAIAAELATAKEAHASTVVVAASEYESQIAALRAELEATSAARTNAEQGQSDLTKQRDAARKRVEKLQAEVDELLARPVVDPAQAEQVVTLGSKLQQAEGEIAALKGQLQTATAQLEAVRGEHSAKFAALESEHAKAREGVEAGALILASVKDELTAALNGRAALEQQVKDLTQQNESARKRIEKLNAEVDELLKRPAIDPVVAAEIEDLKKQLAVAKEAGAQAMKQLDLFREASEIEITTQKQTHRAEVTKLKDEAAAASELLEKLREEQAAFAAIKLGLEQGLAGMTRERDAAMAASRAAELRLQTAETALAARDIDLGKLATEAESLKTAAKSQIEVATEALRQERDAIAAELAATRERTRTLLSTNEKEHRASIISLTEERDNGRKESAALAQRIAEMRIESEKQSASQQSQIEQLKAELARMAAEVSKGKHSTEEQSSVFARELKALAEQRDKAISDAHAAVRELQVRTTGIDESRMQAERLAEEKIGRLEREVSRLRRERDQLIEQRDELRDRIAGMAEAQQRLAKEIDLHSAKTDPLPTDVIQKKRESRESNVIDITEAEVLQPGEPDNAGGVRPPRLRPVVVPPPNVRVL